MKKIIALLLIFPFIIEAKNIYINPAAASDKQLGTENYPFASLESLEGNWHTYIDTLFLAGNITHSGTIEVINSSNHLPMVITSYGDGVATIDAKGYAQAILLENSSNIKVQNLSMTAEAGGFVRPAEKNSPMRCGILILATNATTVENITISHVDIDGIYYEEEGYSRNSEEVKTANGTQHYGWGIRVINRNEEATVKDISIEHTLVTRVSHTGIKISGHRKSSIENIKITNCEVEEIGGPGMQFGSVNNAYIAHNKVLNSGSTIDTRHWGRGSGMWTWGASDFLIERNSFIGANGPGDSAGAHIDYNCNNIILQYNLSANNAGGFIEILGNCYNCAYRFNISVNDGFREKDVAGAFQEGKTLWLSGFVGETSPRHGPYNSYIYNNTIYLSKNITSKMAIENKAVGALIVNNIFYVEGDAVVVPGDQYRPEKASDTTMKNIEIVNNLYLHSGALPKEYKDIAPLYGDPLFRNGGGLSPADYEPLQGQLTNQGVKIDKIAGDEQGLINGLHVEYDFNGAKIVGNILGAIQCSSLSAQTIRR